MESIVTLFALPIAKPLIDWYEKSARKLPWRETDNPYHIWISEIMLQQTRVETVKPYYMRFLAALADIESLARIEDNALLKLWEGLGYYSRARNMKSAANVLLQEYAGQLPKDFDALRRLPGIGPYTAGAILSFAFDIPAPAVDANVLRVLSRLCASAADILLPRVMRDAQSAVLEMMRGVSPRVFNSALMELGALVCLPHGEPLCAQCPIKALCAASRGGNASAFPIKAKKAPRRIERYTMFALQKGERFAARRRSESGLLAGLWELPHVPSIIGEEQMTALLSEWNLSPAGDIRRYARKHIFTHIEWHMRVYAMQVSGSLPEGWEWADRAHSGHALPTAFSKCLPD